MNTILEIDMNMLLERLKLIITLAGMVVEEATTLEDTTSARSSTTESVDICLKDVVICEPFEKRIVVSEL